MSTPAMEIRSQKPLSPRLTMLLVIRSIRYRLLRSALTLMVISLAVVFLMSMLTGNAILTRVGDVIEQDTLDRHLASRRIAEISTKPFSLGHGERLQSLDQRLHARDRRARESATHDLNRFSAITGMPPQALRDLAQEAFTEHRLLAFFANLDFARRRVLVGTVEGREILVLLTAADERKKFYQHLGQMGTVRLPLDRKHLDHFLDAWPEYQERLVTFMNAFHAAVDRAEINTASVRAGASHTAFLSRAGEPDRETWRLALGAAGFPFTRTEVDLMVGQIRADRIRDEVSRTLTKVDKRKAWRATFFDDPTLPEKLTRLDNPKVVPLLDNKWEGPELSRTAKTIRENMRLAKLEERLLQRRGGEERGEGLTSRQKFLLIIAFMVCLVGIANAMLIAITERYKEIATMKCLGATDSFIMMLFTFEAAFQGAVGGVLGSVVGLAVELIRGSFTWGGHLWRNLPVVDLAQAGALAFAMGIGISIVASLYPSWAASRMLPMEAMRVD